MPVIAIDCMSGDVGPEACVDGALRALEARADLSLELVGQRERIEARLGGRPSHSSRVSFIDAEEVVAMHESPRQAIRRRKRSSMRIAIDRVAAGLADAVVSSGNTGALTAMAHFVLKCIPAVERAPILSAIPSRDGFTLMLDLGANTRATPVQLQQFAIMGAIVARDVYGIATPRVGLLNIGTEEIKGHEIVQEAHALLRGHFAEDRPGGSVPGAYVGFVEGNDIFGDGVDVVVTDGFTGNVALKTMEGAAALIGDRLKREFTATATSKLAGLVARPVLERVIAGLDPRRFNGAVMVGLRSVVVKSHGRADALAFARAIEVAAHAVERGLVAHVTQALGGESG